MFRVCVFHDLAFLSVIFSSQPPLHKSQKFQGGENEKQRNGEKNEASIRGFYLQLYRLFYFTLFFFMDIKENC